MLFAVAELFVNDSRKQQMCLREDYVTILCTKNYSYLSAGFIELRVFDNVESGCGFFKARCII